MNIFLTWDSSWIWKWIFNDLSLKYNVFGVSRNWNNCFDLTLDTIKIREKFKDIKFDVIILNAWIWFFWNFYEWKLKEYENIINLNLLANIRLLKNLKYDFKTKIIFMWSYAWKHFFKWWCVYQASKFWLRWFAGSLKKEWYNCFIINPKIIETNFHPKNLDISKLPKNQIKDVVKAVKKIINDKEKKFEIDL